MAKSALVSFFDCYPDHQLLVSQDCSELLSFADSADQNFTIAKLRSGLCLGPNSAVTSKRLGTSGLVSLSQAYCLANQQLSILAFGIPGRSQPAATFYTSAWSRSFGVLHRLNFDLFYFHPVE